MDKPGAAESFITVDQLQPGVFIRLETTWFNHPFLFNKFKVKNSDQIRTLKKLGIKEVIYVPEKSDCMPKPLDEIVAPKKQAEPVQADSPAKDPFMRLLWQIKKDRIERLKEKHESLRRCTGNYNQTIRRVPSLMADIMTGGKDAVAHAQVVVSKMVDVFVQDTDAIVHLINIKEKGEGIYYHSLNVSILALMLGKKAKLNPDEMNSLGMGSLFHDIGKSRIEKKVLRKPPPLTKAESELIQLHPKYGVEIATQSGGFPPEATQIIFQHHEQYNGQGYPQRLRGEQITRLARITAIVDEYDNLCNPLDLEKSMTPYQALSYMYTKRQDRLDMELFSIFIRSLGIYPPGTVVKLSNGMHGIVISINPQNPLKPSLMLYDPDIPKDEALIFDMEDDMDVSIETSVRPEKLAPEIRWYLSPSARITYFADAAKPPQGR